MGFADIFSMTNICSSGLAAERLRMEVVANNIANAGSTRTVAGGPYRRQEVVFAAAMERALSASGNAGPQLQGVRIVGVQPTDEPLPTVYRPGHPDADEHGMVTMPNVELPREMVDLITASRAYEANLRVMRSFRDLVEQSLSLMRST